jgi:lysophospholipase L1-like esterase
VPAKPETVTVYLAGDSTVTNQEHEPWCAWGQMLPRFFGPGVAVANHAHSGEALISFAAERRLDKIAETIKAGDYLFVQFAHNDQKPGGAHADPATTYPKQLRRYIGVARKVGATPVLVTSMHRRRFDEAGKLVNTLGDYPDAVRRVAREEKVPLVDLNALSRTFYEALGPDQSKRAFVHFPANTFPDQPQALKDDTHFSDYGAYELARCVVEGIRSAVPGLAKRLAPDAAPFDPACPDPFETFMLPASGPASGETPAQVGNQNTP